MLGNGIKIIQPNEYVTLNNQRKCIYAKKDIKKGSIITDKMIQIKGPGGGILPKYLEIILGRKATSEIKKDHPIMWKNIWFDVFKYFKKKNFQKPKKFQLKEKKKLLF